MFELKVHFDERKFRDAASKAVMESLTKHIKQQVGSLRCPTHGQAPTVHVKGHSLDNLSFEVGGCCQDLIDRVTAKLK
jgi:hypothetical protein